MKKFQHDYITEEDFVYDQDFMDSFCRWCPRLERSSDHPYDSFFECDYTSRDCYNAWKMDLIVDLIEKFNRDMRGILGD